MLSAILSSSTQHTLYIITPLIIAYCYQTDLHTITTIAASINYKTDRMWLNGVEIELNGRLLTCLREVRKIASDKVDPVTGETVVRKEDWDNYRVHISSVNTFPTGAGDSGCKMYDEQ